MVALLDVPAVGTFRPGRWLGPAKDAAEVQGSIFGFVVCEKVLEGHVLVHTSLDGTSTTRHGSITRERGQQNRMAATGIRSLKYLVGGVLQKVLC